FRRIVSVDEETVVLQPGLVLAQLNARLNREGRMFGPDPAALEVTTLGSMLARDASGSRWPAYGSRRHDVEGLAVVVANGKTARLSRHRPDPAAALDEDPGGYLAAGVADILHRHEGAIGRRQTKSLVDRSGYQPQDLQTDD